MPLPDTSSLDAGTHGYLPASVRDFPGPDAVAAMMANAGLTKVRYLILAGGIVAIHLGTKP